MALRLKPPNPATVAIVIGALWWLLRMHQQAQSASPTPPRNPS